MRFENQEFWKGFIRMYKSYPEIWDSRHEDYKNRRLKKKIYKKLLEKLQTFEPQATDMTLKRRILSLRSSYRREAAKVQKSKESGRRKIHKPNLWYFDELSFVQYQGRPMVDCETLIQIVSEDDCDLESDDTKSTANRPPTKTRTTTELSSESDESSQDNKPSTSQLEKYATDQAILSTPQSSKSGTEQLTSNYNADSEEDTKPNQIQLEKYQVEEVILSAPPRKKRTSAQPILNTSASKDPITDLARTQPQANACTTCRTHEKDEADIFAAGWATLFRKLSPDQQLFANKIIGEVLYQGAMGNLTKYS